MYEIGKKDNSRDISGSLMESNKKGLGSWKHRARQSEFLPNSPSAKRSPGLVLDKKKKENIRIRRWVMMVIKRKDRERKLLWIQL